MKQACLGVLNKGRLVASINGTNLVLIPKKTNPIKVANYRPISLCNVIYKLVTKTIANRLKLVLPHLISSQQSAFVPKRLITNNVISAFKLIHSLGNRRYSRNGFMALKLDISKAYDRVERPFVCKVMERMGFPLSWQHMVYDCMSMARFAFWVNGIVQGHVIPSRGLRRKCSLPPYLFLLCVEAFSALIRRDEVERSLVGL